MFYIIVQNCNLVLSVSKTRFTLKYLLFCVFFGIVAGFNISLTFSSFITFCSLAILYIALSDNSRLVKEVALIFVWVFGFVAASGHWLALAIYYPAMTSITMTWLVASFVYALHAAIYATTYLILRLTVAFLFLNVESQHDSIKNDKKTQAQIIICLPLSLAIAEIIRTLGFWAMPWGMIGHTQTSNPFLVGLYPVIGTYGVTFMTALFSIVVVLCLKSVKNYKEENVQRHWLCYFKNNAMNFSCLLLVLGTVYASKFVAWTQATGEELKVRVVHTHMPNIQKYDPIEQQLAQEKMLALAQLNDVDFTFYPELYMVQHAYAIDKKLRESIVEAVAKTKNAQIFGSPSYKVNADGIVIGLHNALIELDENRKTRLYAKEILVPFSEYMPDHPALSWAMPYILSFPLSNFTSGMSNNPEALSVKNTKLAASLCNEIAYTFNEHLHAANAGVLINAASDSWVPSKLYELHSWQLVKVRTLEAQKPILRSNNTGYSGYIDAWGSEQQMPYGQESTEVFTVFPRSGSTPFTRLIVFLSHFQIF